MPDIIEQLAPDLSEPLVATVKDMIATSFLKARVRVSIEFEKAADLTVSRACRRYVSHYRTELVRPRMTASEIYAAELRSPISRYIEEYHRFSRGTILSMPEGDRTGWDLHTESLIRDEQQNIDRTYPALFFPDGLKEGDTFAKIEHQSLAVHQAEGNNGFLEDWRWVHSRIRDGVAWQSEYVAVLDKKIVAKGNTFANARDAAAQAKGVPANRIVVVYVGDR